MTWENETRQHKIVKTTIKKKKKKKKSHSILAVVQSQKHNTQTWKLKYDKPNHKGPAQSFLSELHFVWYMLCYVFLIIKIVMLCGIIFHCNFF